LGRYKIGKRRFSYARLLVGHSLLPVAETSTEGVGEGTIGVGGDGGNNGSNKGDLVAVGHTIAVKILHKIKYNFIIISIVRFEKEKKKLRCCW